MRIKRIYQQGGGLHNQSGGELNTGDVWLPLYNFFLFVQNMAVGVQDWQTSVFMSETVLKMCRTRRGTNDYNTDVVCPISFISADYFTKLQVLPKASGALQGISSVHITVDQQADCRPTMHTVVFLFNKIVRH